MLNKNNIINKILIKITKSLIKKKYNDYDNKNQSKKSFIRFINIKTFYRNYNTSFKSKSKLHKHL